MPLRKSRKKTSDFLSKTIKRLKSMLVFHESQSISTQPQCNPFSCSGRKVLNKDVGRIKHQQEHQMNDFYSDRWIMDGHQFDHGNVDFKINSSTSVQDKAVIVVSSNNIIDDQCIKKNKQQDGERKIKMVLENKEEAAGCLKTLGGSYRVISRRMKELEMLEFKDMDHLLDVEEVLHYYSRLRSPVYLDIVDSFFTNMYTELRKPQRNCMHGGSTRRLGPVKLAAAT